MDSDQENEWDSRILREKIKVDLLIHDLKVPLAVIEAGVASLLNKTETYGPLTEKQEKVLSRLLRNARIGQTLLRDVLELRRCPDGGVKHTSVMLSNFIKQVLIEMFDLIDGDTSEKMKQCVLLPQLRKMLEEKGVLLIVDEGLWCQEVCLDVAKMKQVLRNLLNNALKYRKNHVELVVHKKVDDIVFSVRDDGKGIPSVYHNKIFDNYFQIDPVETFSVKGHGLGLTGVMALLTEMGGKLFLESQEGDGTKFLVEVPCPSG